MAGALLTTGSTTTIRYLRESLRLMWELGHAMWIVEPLAGLASVIGASGDLTSAVRLLGRADRLRTESGTDVRTPEQRAAAEHTMARARVELGEAAVAEMWSAGKALPTNDAVADALARSEPLLALQAMPVLTVLPSSSPPPAATSVGRGLSQREQEVLALLCQRLTDAEIATVLFISPKTVGHHVGHILTKLGVPNRREAAAIAARQQLV